MFDKETLIALQEADAITRAHDALENACHSHDSAALPSDFVLHDLENKLLNRRRARGHMATTSLASFVGYTDAHAELGTSVFVDADTMRAIAILNLGNPDAAGHADNKATYTPEKTAAYRALLAMTSGNGSAHKQAVIAEFLEDWPELIKCYKDTASISPPQAIAAIRKISIESIRKAESSVQSLSESRSAFETVSATSADPLPTHIYFTCQPYAPLPVRTFVLRLGVLTGSDKPMVGLRIVKAEQHSEEMAQELVDLVSSKFAKATQNELEKEGMSDFLIPVLQGTYTKSA